MSYYGFLVAWCSDISGPDAGASIMSDTLVKQGAVLHRGWILSGIESYEVSRDDSPYIEFGRTSKKNETETNIRFLQMQLAIIL